MVNQTLEKGDDLAQNLGASDQAAAELAGIHGKPRTPLQEGTSQSLVFPKKAPERAKGSVDDCRANCNGAVYLARAQRPEAEQLVYNEE